MSEIMNNARAWRLNYFQACFGLKIEFQGSEVNFENGWVDKSMAEKHILKILLLCFENSTCVFGRPAVFYELRIQPFLLFLNVKNCCCCNWSHDGEENNILLLTNIFSLLSTCQSCYCSTEKLIECKWDNTNSCCVADPNHLQNLLLGPRNEIIHTWFHFLISIFTPKIIA